MRLNKIIQDLSLEPVVLPDGNIQVTEAYTSDLMSDVMGNAQMENFILITIQAHPNTVAVCTMLDAVAILICNHRQISPEMIDAATKHKIAILRTPLSQFEISGKLFQLFKK